MMFSLGILNCIPLEEFTYLSFKNMDLRYVGVIWFAFHVLQLLPMRSTQQKLVLH